MADGRTPLFRDEGSTRKIAKEAVKKVYQHVSSPKDTAYLEQTAGARASVSEEISDRMKMELRTSIRFS